MRMHATISTSTVVPYAPVAGVYVPHMPVHPKVPELLSRQQYEQRTPEWYEVRKGLMTASDAAGALGIPAFKGQRNVRQSLLQQKVSGSFTGNHMTRWGQENEDQVRERAMRALGEVAWEVGLVVHPELSWLGASPDGVTNTGKLIEIKCPYKRKPDPCEVPHHYWPQIQVQLECTDLDSCYFVQWQPAELAPDNQEVFSIIVVERDKQWFAENKDHLHQFWVDLMQMRRTYVPPPPPPPPECQVRLDMYDLSGVEDDEDFSFRSKKPRRIIDDDDDDDKRELNPDDYSDVMRLRQKLLDALEAVDAWTHKHRNNPS